MLYIASQEAMRKEDFLHGRTFESSNSPLAGVKANTKFEQRKAQKGCFMNEETKVTAAPTLAEKLGIEYKEVDGFYYPVLEETEENEFLKLGKWGHRWLGLMMEHDRYLYNLYFMGGVLYQKAKEYEDYAWQLHDELVEKLKASRNVEHAMSDTMEKIHRVQEIESTVEEIINNDLYEMIDTIKEQRAVYIKEYMEQKAELED